MRELKIAGVVFLVVTLVLVGIFLSIGYYLSPQDNLRHADIIVAVSGGETESRTAEAVALYKQGYAPELLFSGAAQDRSGPSNAAAMRSIAISKGVPSENIKIEENAANTTQNANNSAGVIRQDGAHSIILVTSPYHQRRAGIEFSRALGPEVAIVNHSAPDQKWRRSHWWATTYSFNLTLSELQKTIYVLGKKNITTPSASSIN